MVSKKFLGLAISAVIAGSSSQFKAEVEKINEATRDWTMRAARGECEWICADCSCGFPNGMPDECLHGHYSCTEIIKRDKAQAAIAKHEGGK